MSVDLELAAYGGVALVGAIILLLAVFNVVSTDSTRRGRLP